MERSALRESSDLVPATIRMKSRSHYLRQDLDTAVPEVLESVTLNEGKAMGLVPVLFDVLQSFLVKLYTHYSSTYNYYNT